MSNRSRILIVAAGLVAAALSQPVAADPAPLQPFELEASLNGTERACVTDPSSWRQPNAAHDALVEQGYTTSFWIATHPGFSPFSDQLYFLCRSLQADSSVSE